MLTCLITGANRGIGLELTRHYVKAGATVIAAARTPAEAVDLKKLQAAHPTLEVVPLEVTDLHSIQSLAKSLAGRPIDRLIANAGVIGPRGGMSDSANSPAAWAQVLGVNVTGVFFTIQAFADNVAAARGKVAIISSRMGSSSAAAGTSYLYRTSKAAAANLGANFAVEFKPKGVAVGVYHPGWVKTDMGGQGADIDATVSAGGLAARIEHLTIETTGIFEDYAGKPIPY